MRVHLASCTEDPIGTIVRLWRASRETVPYEAIDEARYSLEHNAEDLELFRNVVQLGLPVTENVVFNFVLEDVPISWREQAVRHRIGVHYGDNFGVDIVPDGGTGITFWSQTMRVQDMSTFAEDGRYYTPDTILEHEEALSTYHQAMDDIEAAYYQLVGYGIPREDARQLIPLGATHRISMSINLRALQNIIGKRGCWISQSNLWMPVIRGMVDALAEEVHPIFREMVYPPCIEGGVFAGCKFKHENERRVDGRDAMPVCPLYWTHHVRPAPEEAVPPLFQEVQGRTPEYADLWGQPRLPETWAWESR